MAENTGVVSSDVAVVGAGAAGLMAALAAARVAGQKRSIRLFDSRKKIGAKILISGGTRCNVTNVRVLPSDYQGGPSHFVRHVLEAFTPAETLSFFEELGVELVLEPTGKYFPVTHSGKTVLEALLKAVEDLKPALTLETGSKVVDARFVNGAFLLEILREGSPAPIRWNATRLILATGGLSYPETGSDGAGLVIAERLGHRIVKTAPALTPLVTEDEGWKALSGMTLSARLSFFKSGKKSTETKGSFLFTHFGFSGPAALDISRHVSLAGPHEKPEVFASFLPEENEESLWRRFEAARDQHPVRFVSTFLTGEGLPERLAAAMLVKAGVEEKTPLIRCPLKAARRLFHLVLNAPLNVTGVVGYRKAEVTAGGVDLRDVHVSTLESKIVKGLYFAGEILDVDGRIGGFNFQWAWSSGALAGRSAAK